jgi:CheY-like chemotaxis protein
LEVSRRNEDLLMLSALVVDHDLAAAWHTGMALATAGFTVHLAADTAEAVAAQGARHLDLVVCDVSVVGYEGQTLVQTLRAAGTNATCIAITSDPSPEVRQRWRVVGAALCLRKPVDPAILGAIARQLVTQGHLCDSREDPFDAELTDLVRPRYLDLLPARAATLRDTLDLPDLARASRTLAGASAQFGYPGLADLCRIVQQEARAGRRDPELIEVVVTAAGHIQRTSL